jgi:hypothetical protein
MNWSEHMPIMVNVTQEKQRISDQLVKVDAERSKLQDRLNELEIAERVLSRFGPQKGATQRRGRPAGSRSTEVSQKKAIEKETIIKETKGNQENTRAATRRRPAGRSESRSMPLGEATLRAVQAHSGGVSADEVKNYIAKQFGLTVRPNHLGMALQRHRRAGRLEIRDSRWHLL